MKDMSVKDSRDEVHPWFGRVQFYDHRNVHYVPGNTTQRRLQERNESLVIFVRAQGNAPEDLFLTLFGPILAHQGAPAYLLLVCPNKVDRPGLNVVW